MINPQKEDYILEYGSWIGNIALECAKRGAFVEGIEIHENAIKSANILFAQHFPKYQKMAEFRIA